MMRGLLRCRASALVAIPAALLAQEATTTPTATLEVSVKSAEDSTRLAGAEVWIPSLGRLTRTDSAGAARLVQLPVGSRSVRVRMLGYAPVQLEIDLFGDTVALDLQLHRSTTRLDEVTVTADRVPFYLEEFEQRRRIGTGRYITEAQLQHEGDRRFSTVAAMLVPGLREVLVGGSSRLASTRGSCGYKPEDPRSGDRESCFSNKPCLIQTYLDGVRLYDDSFDLLRTWDTAAIEYYTGATVPAQYRIPGSACGVLLVWSKR